MGQIVSFDYFYGGESEQFSYYRIPRILITGAQFRGLSTDAKLLYGLLLDRMGLSARNGWYDDQGRVFIYYTLDEIQADLNCGHSKAVKLLAELDAGKGIGLIERVKQGQGKPAKIFVKRFTTREVPDMGSQDFPYPEMQTAEKEKPRFPVFRSAEFPKPDASYNNINHPEKSYTDPSIHLPELMDRCEIQQEIMENIDYEHLLLNHLQDEVDSLLELITDVLSTTAPSMRIGGATFQTETVKKRFRQLDSSHIEYVMDSMSQTTTKIKNIRAYLLTALYNAPVTIGSYYYAAVRHDYG